MILVGLTAGIVQADAMAARLRVVAPLISPPWSGAVFIEESIHYLSWQLPDDEIVLQWERTQDIPRLLNEGRYDIGILPAAVIDYHSMPSLRALTSMASRRAPDPDHGAAGVFVVKDNAPWHQLSDLNGLKATTSDKSIVGGYLACMAEIAYRGWDTEKFFSSLDVFGVLNDRMVLDAVRDGRADVALLRSSYVEDVKEANGRDALKGLRVITPQSDQLLDVHSTRTYPGPTLYSAEHVDPKLIHRVLSTLLSKPVNGWGQFWTVPSHQEGTDALARALKIGPYAYLKEWSLERIWREYRTAISVGLVFILGLLIHSWRSEVLIRKRTSELREAMEQQLRAERALQVQNERIQSLEKDVLVGHLSSIFAHEMNLPLGSIRNVLHGMRVAVDEVLGVADEKTAALLMELDEGLRVIQGQLTRAVDIVNRVRAYAKNPSMPTQVNDLNVLLVNVYDNLRARMKNGQALKMERSTIPVWVRCDPMELEVVIQNLLKNALEAAPQGDGPEVLVVVTQNETSAILEIENACTDSKESMLALMSQGRVPSSKPEGLGLGLKIVGTLIERYEGKLTFEKQPDGKIKTILTLPKAQREEKEPNHENS